jgi:hypothetical protein
VGGRPAESPSKPEGDGVLTWSDEFNGSAGSSPDTTEWVIESGRGGWGEPGVANLHAAPRERAVGERTRIAINSALMKLRENRSCREVLMDEPATADGTLPPHELSPDQEAHYAQGERQQIVASAVRGLRPAPRKVGRVESFKKTP